MKIHIASRTHEGVVRDHNEDNFILFADLTRRMTFPSDPLDTVTVGPDGTLMVVADGMGGMNAGEVASETAVQTVNEKFGKEALNLTPEEVKGILFDTIKAANQAIARHGKENPDTDGMGTTLIIGWVRDGHLYCSWIGDSRAYVYRPELGLFPVSKDHSLVQEWVDAGRMTYEEAFHHPQNHIVTQSLGDGSRDLEPGYSVTPLQDGDCILLCSDGLNGMLEDPQIEAILSREGLLPEITAQLVNAANNAGGHDNITVILTEVSDIPTELIPVPEAQPLKATTTAELVAPVAGGGGSVSNSIFSRLESSKNRWKLMALALMTLFLAFFIAWAFYIWDEQPQDKELLKAEEKKQEEVSGGTSGTRDSDPERGSSNTNATNQQGVESSPPSSSQHAPFSNPISNGPAKEKQPPSEVEVTVQSPAARALEEEKRKELERGPAGRRAASEDQQEDTTDKGTSPGTDTAGKSKGIDPRRADKSPIDTILNPKGGGTYR